MSMTNDPDRAEVAALELLGRAIAAVLACMGVETFDHRGRPVDMWHLEPGTVDPGTGS